VADTVVASGANASMDDLPLWLQATGGDAALPYSATLWRTEFDAMFQAEGVLSTPAWKVTQRGAGANFSVDVAAGSGVILGDSVASQGKYIARSVGAVNVTTPAAPGAGTRIHRVIARIRDKAAAGTNYDWTLELREDTGTGTPALDASAISLATVSIAAGQASVLDANITDTRPFAWLAGMPYLIAYKTADNGSTLSTTLINDDHLFQYLPASTTWLVQGNIGYYSDPADDMKFGWSGPSGATFRWSPGHMPSTIAGGTVANTTVQNWNTSIATTEVAGGSGAPTPVTSLRPQGLLTIGSTPGIFRFQFCRSIASSANGTTTLQGSTLLFARVA
jgi:hypothetical protein